MIWLAVTHSWVMYVDRRAEYHNGISGYGTQGKMMEAIICHDKMNDVIHVVSRLINLVSSWRSFDSGLCFSLPKCKMY